MRHFVLGESLPNSEVDDDDTAEVPAGRRIACDGGERDTGGEGSIFKERTEGGDGGVERKNEPFTPAMHSLSHCGRWCSKSSLRGETGFAATTCFE